MSTTNELPESMAAAIAEASRIAAEAARQNTETARASIEAASSSMDDANALGQELLGTWTKQSEAAMKAAYKAQNAAIETGLGMFDVGVKGDREAVEMYAELVKQTQKATLESWHAAVKASVQAAETAK